ncbi:MAG: hypothetical protein GY716_15680 [bacterium]|nr:hypothetical protein [bacterium]
MSRFPSTGLRRSLDALYDFLAGAPSLLNEDEARTSGASEITLDITQYQSTITTGATEGSEDVSVGDGTGAIVGQRKLITLGTRSHASDVVNLDHANMVDTDGSTALTNMDLDAADEFWLGQWNGTAWVTIYTTGTLAT